MTTEAQIQANNILETLRNFAKSDVDSDLIRKVVLEEINKDVSLVPVLDEFRLMLAPEFSGDISGLMDCLTTALCSAGKNISFGSSDCDAKDGEIFAVTRDKDGEETEWLLSVKQN